MTLTATSLITPFDVKAQNVFSSQGGSLSLAISRYCVDTTMEVWMSTVSQASRMQTYLIFDVIRSHGCGRRHSRPVSEFFGFAALSLERVRLRTTLRASQPGFLLEACRIVVNQCPDVDVELRWMSMGARTALPNPVKTTTRQP